MEDDLDDDEVNEMTEPTPIKVTGVIDIQYTAYCTIARRALELQYIPRSQRRGIKPGSLDERGQICLPVERLAISHVRLR